MKADFVDAVSLEFGMGDLCFGGDFLSSLLSTLATCLTKACSFDAS